MRTKFNRKQLERILHMYKPSTVYLQEAEIHFPTLKAPLVFPKTPIYLKEGLGITHINNSEVEMIINQGMFVFYRRVLLDGQLNFPKILEEELPSYYNEMFIKKEIDYYERFTSRNKTDLILTLEHLNTRKIGSAQLIWCNLLIPKFMKAEIIGGLNFNK